MIYFIQAGSAREPIQIGYARNERELADHIRHLERYCPRTPDLLVTIPGGSAKLRTLHHTFETYRENGEWFRTSGELRRLINNYHADPGHEPDLAAVRRRAIKVQRHFAQAKRLKARIDAEKAL